MLAAAASCLTLLALIFGMVAIANRDKIREFFADMTDAWRDITRVLP